jgi:hypothetical protein
MKSAALINISIVAIIIVLLYILYKIQETFEVTPTPTPTMMSNMLNTASITPMPMPTYASITLPESAVPYKSLLTNGSQGTLNVFNPVVRKF